jgi:hypothetical protein
MHNMYEETLAALGSVKLHRRWLTKDVSQVVQLEYLHVVTAHVPSASNCQGCHALPNDHLDMRSGPSGHPCRIPRDKGHTCGPPPIREHQARCYQMGTALQ